MNKKLTDEQAKEIRKLRKLGLKDREIAIKYNVSVGTINNCINGRKGKSKKTDGIGNNPEEIPLSIRQNLAKQEEEKPFNRIKKGVCRVCGKKKQPRFRLTNFCSLECFKIYEG